MKIAISVVVSLVIIVAVAYLPAESAEPPETTTISFELPTAKIPKLLAAFKGLFPIPTIEDPENPNQQIPKYSDTAWARYKVKEYMKSIVKRHGDKLKKEADPVVVDDELFIED